MPATDTDSQFKFLISCIKFSTAGRVDFDKVAQDQNIVTKAAAAKRYERLMKAHGVQPNYVAAYGGGDGTATPKGKGRGKAKDAATPGAKSTPAKSASARKRKAVDSDDEEDVKPAIFKGEPSVDDGKTPVKKELGKEEESLEDELVVKAEPKPSKKAKGSKGKALDRTEQLSQQLDDGHLTMDKIPRAPSTPINKNLDTVKTEGTIYAGQVVPDISDRDDDQDACVVMAVKTLTPVFGARRETAMLAPPSPPPPQSHPPLPPLPSPASDTISFLSDNSAATIPSSTIATTSTLQPSPRAISPPFSPFRANQTPSTQALTPARLSRSLMTHGISSGRKSTVHDALLSSRTPVFAASHQRSQSSSPLGLPSSPWFSSMGSRPSPDHL